VFFFFLDLRLLLGNVLLLLETLLVTLTLLIIVLRFLYSLISDKRLSVWA